MHGKPSRCSHFSAKRSSLGWRLGLLSCSMRSVCLPCTNPSFCEGGWGFPTENCWELGLPSPRQPGCNVSPLVLLFNRDNVPDMPVSIAGAECVRYGGQKCTRSSALSLSCFVAGLWLAMLKFVSKESLGIDQVLQALPDIVKVNRVVKCR